MTLHIGTARFERQLYVGLHSKSSRGEWLKGAYEEAKKGQNPYHYILAREACIHFGLLQGPGGHDAWLNNCEYSNNAERTRLETELRSCRHKQIKDTMRVSVYLLKPVKSLTYDTIIVCLRRPRAFLHPYRRLQKRPRELQETPPTRRIRAAHPHR